MEIFRQMQLQKAKERKGSKRLMLIGIYYNSILKWLCVINICATRSKRECRPDARLAEMQIWNQLRCQSRKTVDV